MDRISNGACLSCGICVDICPKNAIELVVDHNGFNRPMVLQEKCIQCRKCVQTCIQNYKITGTKYKKTYKGYSRDEALLLRSTSGGIIGELYRYFLNLGYAVCGVEYDEKWNCRFRITRNESDVLRFHGSKYIGADTSGIYQKVAGKLRKGEGVLFVGTPCQCAGLRRYLGEQNQFPKLFVCDLLCWGVGSQYAFHKYLSEISRDDTVVNYTMRSKNRGQSKYCESKSEITTQSGRVLTPEFYKTGFGYLFATGLVVKDECFECPFASQERYGDITVGDWKNKLNNYQSKWGCSLILSNTRRGYQIIQELKDKNRIVVEPLREKEVLRKCSRLSSKTRKPPQKEQYMNQIHKHSIQNIVGEYKNELESSNNQQWKIRLMRILDLFRFHK